MRASSGSATSGVDGLTPQLARQLGIETVHQHLALCDNLGAAANVMLGQEPVRFRLGPVKLIDRRASLEQATRLVADVGIDLGDYWTPVRRLSAASGRRSRSRARPCAAIA